MGPTLGHLDHMGALESTAAEQYLRVPLAAKGFCPSDSLPSILGESSILAATVRAQLGASGFAARLKPGARVAIGVGSRGINNIANIVYHVVQYWKEQGMQPLIFPAMGSHGAANAAGQAEVLASYGITEATMGCPLISQLEVVSLGKTADGIEAFMDKVAYEADGVMLAQCGRT